MRKSNACALACLVCLAAASHARGEPDALSGIAADLELSQTLAEIETGSERERQLEQEREQLDHERSALHATLQERVHALYRLTRSGMSPVNGGFAAVRAHVARVHRLRASVEDEAHAWARLEQRTDAARSESELTEQSLGHARERLQTLQAEVARAEPHTRTRAPETERERERDRDLLEPAAGAKADPVDHGFYGLRLAEEPRSSFVALHGKLAAPVAGEVRVTDLQRGPAEGPALAFEAPAGTPVLAVAAGRVAFSEVFGGNGRQVILDHGGGYFTAYSQLGRVEVRTGDVVSAHARIGDIGPGTQPSALVFELRKGSRALPPRAWLGL
jgi:septal ring factor EnvC (AmiA/AmiB activator)